MRSAGLSRCEQVSYVTNSVRRPKNVSMASVLRPLGSLENRQASRVVHEGLVWTTVGTSLIESPSAGTTNDYLAINFCLCPFQWRRYALHCSSPSPKQRAQEARRSPRSRRTPTTRPGSRGVLLYRFMVGAETTVILLLLWVATAGRAPAVGCRSGHVRISI